MTGAATIDRPARDADQPSARPAPHVWLVDPFCFTPWYTAELALALRGAGADVRLVASEFSREPRYFDQLGLRPCSGCLHLSRLVRKAPPLSRRLVRTAEVLLNYHSLKRSMRERAAHGQAVLHLQQTPLLQHGLSSDLALVDHAKALAIPVVHTVHNLLPHDSGPRLHGIYQQLYRRVDHLICHSPAAAQALVELFAISPTRISVIPHGPLFAPRHPPREPEMRAARVALGLPSQRRIVLWQGVLAGYKGLDLLLEAWTLCLRRCADRDLPVPLLLIAGSGPASLVSSLRTRLASVGDTVRADLRYIPTEQLPLYYTAADILVYPYHAITTSGALLTGLSYEKPIIASDLPTFAESLRQGDNALLVEPDNPRALTQALVLLLEDQGAAASPAAERPYSGLLAKLAAGARNNRARCTSWAEIGRVTTALYRTLHATRLSPT